MSRNLLEESYTDHIQEHFNQRRWDADCKHCVYARKQGFAWVEVAMQKAGERQDDPYPNRLFPSADNN